ncbi:hypothetical protein J7J12_03005 [bacterium]|nr:hypothetical protein [bacterium]
MWETIKRLLQKTDGKYIIVEEDKPKYVIMGIEEYEKLLGISRERNSYDDKDFSEIKKVNEEIEKVKSEEKREPDTGEIIKDEETKVEELPF